MCKTAGVTKIDNLLITHYHGDHVGGVPQLVGKLPVRNFVDHGATVESDPRHHFGMGEMFGATAHFPNSLVRFVPI